MEAIGKLFQTSILQNVKNSLKPVFLITCIFSWVIRTVVSDHPELHLNPVKIRGANGCS